ncbi:ABC transporter permease subunit [Streptomyces rameus]|uniref:ABC transporter permease subunit n=1 Tax=Streptomyces rameus TaxID=68261 RepID=UPI003CD0A6B8
MRPRRAPGRGPPPPFLHPTPVPAIRPAGRPTHTPCATVRARPREAPAAVHLTGLRSAPAELTAAALIDGASARQRLRHVTLPLLAPPCASASCFP